MHGTTKTVNSAIALWGLITLAGLGAGCGGGHSAATTTPATRNAPTALFGTWRLASVSGGLSGRGYPLSANKADREVLTFDANGTVTRTQTGQATNQQSYRVTIRQTIGTSPLPVIIYSLSSTNQVIYSVDAKTLMLYDDGVSEGFSFTYERDTP